MFNDAMIKIFDRMDLQTEPSCTAKYGIKFDFCYGLRVYIPETLKGRKFLLSAVDLTSGLKISEAELTGGDYWCTEQHYFIPIGFQIMEIGTGELVIEHHYMAKDRLVVVDMPVPTLGDSIAWFSYCDAFRKRLQCQLAVCMPDHARSLFEKEYPEIRFVSREEKKQLYPYAHYRIGIFCDDPESKYAPMDYHLCPLHHYAAWFFGVNPVLFEEPPRVTYNREKRTIPEKYVVIASQASGISKNWIYPNGWYEVCKFLLEQGYRVIDIDAEMCAGRGSYYTYIPRNAEDFTGYKPLTERAELIANADFFVGLPSGLSWLAWCCKVPVVMISGFSNPYDEFFTPYRVQNFHVCHGCFSDPRYKFDPKEHDWCPKHKNTGRQFECQLGITPGMVIKMIKAVPTFRGKNTEPKKENE